METEGKFNKKILIVLIADGLKNLIDQSNHKAEMGDFLQCMSEFGLYDHEWLKNVAFEEDIDNGEDTLKERNIDELFDRNGLNTKMKGMRLLEKNFVYIFSCFTNFKKVFDNKWFKEKDIYHLNKTPA